MSLPVRAVSLSKTLVTGAAGFIGFHLCRKLIELGYDVTGIDNLNDYYDPDLKKARLSLLGGVPSFSFVKMDLSDKKGMESLFEDKRFDFVVNLAAQAGVRYSFVNPHAYIKSNIEGFLNVLEGCRHGGVKHLVFASSSSVFGANRKMPFSVHDRADHPVSLYGATKKADELMAHSYAANYGLPCTGLRFFTVYGPWGRPDMSYFLFTKAIIEGKPIGVFNNGKMRRDFTYIDDVVEGVSRVLQRAPGSSPSWNRTEPDPASSYAPFRLYNIGNNTSIELTEFIGVLEGCLGKKAIINLMPMQMGDVEATYADVEDLTRDAGFKPSTPIDRGLTSFVRWFREYYEVN